MKHQQLHLFKIIRYWLLFFMISLIASGVTALDVPHGITWLSKFHYNTIVDAWLNSVSAAITNTNINYPFLFYGYDWLAFAHIVIAVAFIGPYQDPVRNKWVIQFGMIACTMIIPFAFITGGIRGIPFWWQLIDCSFGIIAFWPLGKCYTLIQKLELSEPYLPGKCNSSEYNKIAVVITKLNPTNT